MKKLVIFDLDGTLLDTLKDIAHNVSNALNKVNLESVSESEVRDFVCDGLYYMVENVCKDKTLIPLVVKYYSEQSVENAYRYVKPFKDIIALLEQLKMQGVKMAMLTNKREWQARMLYEDFFARFEFEAVYGNNNDRPLKPNPKGLNDLLRELKIEKSDAILVGDGDTDALTAKNGGIDFVGVTWGYCDKSRIEKAGAINFIDKPIELLKFL